MKTACITGSILLAYHEPHHHASLIFLLQSHFHTDHYLWPPLKSVVQMLSKSDNRIWSTFYIKRCLTSFSALRTIADFDTGQIYCALLFGTIVLKCTCLVWDASSTGIVRRLFYQGERTPLDTRSVMNNTAYWYVKAINGPARKVPMISRLLKTRTKISIRRWRTVERERGAKNASRHGKVL